MIKKISAKILILSIVLMFTAVSDLTAQTQIRFKRGSNSATISGTLGAGITRGYYLRARSGQVLTATVSSNNGKVDFTQGSLHDSQYSMTVENDGNVYISLDNHGGKATKFTMTVSIQ